MEVNGIIIDGMTPEMQPPGGEDKRCPFDPASNIRDIESAIGIGHEITDRLALADMGCRVAWDALKAARLIDEWAGMSDAGSASTDNHYTLQCALLAKAQELRHCLADWIDYLGCNLGYSDLIGLIRPDETTTAALRVDDVLRQRAGLEHLNQIILSKLVANELPGRLLVAEVIAATTQMAAVLDKELRELKAQGD